MFPAEKSPGQKSISGIFGFDPEKTEPSFQLFLENGSSGRSIIYSARSEKAVREKKRL